MNRLDLCLSSGRNRRLPLVAGLLGMLIAAGGCQRSLLAVRESGDSHYSRGQYDAALADYTEYVQRSPGRAEVYHMLGKTYLATGQTGLARENLLIAHSLRLEDDEIFVSTCEALFADKKYEELNRLLRGRTIDRGRMQDYLLLARYAEMQGDMDETRRALLTAAQVDRGVSLEPQIGLARLYYKVGDRSRAISRLRMAYFVSPDNAEVAAMASELGEVVGPTFGQPPEEMMAVAPPVQPTPAEMTEVPTYPADPATP